MAVKKDKWEWFLFNTEAMRLADPSKVYVETFPGTHRNGPFEPFIQGLEQDSTNYGIPIK
jgi:hypothetical protein